MRGKGFLVVLSAVAGLAAAATVEAQTVAPVKAPVMVAKPALAAAVPPVPSKLPPGPCAAVEPLISAGTVALAAQNSYAAKADLTQAVTRAPRCAIARLRRAEILLNQEDMDAAITDATAALALLPAKGTATAEAYAIRGMSEAHQSFGGAPAGDKINAAVIADLSRAIDLGLADLMIVPMRAQAYENAGRNDLALADLNRALTMDPGNVDLILERAEVYQNLGDIDRAIADLAQARAKAGDQEPERSMAYVSSAMAYEARGDTAGAIALLSEVIARTPPDPALLTMRARLYEHQHDYDRALADLTTVIAAGRHPAEAYATRASIYADKGDFTAALADADAVIAAMPKEASGYIARGRINERKGDVAAAIADYDTGATMTGSVDAAEAANAACWVRATHNIELDKALAACGVALAKVPNFANALDSRGFVHLRRGEYAAAVADYTAALKSNPKLAGSLFGRALAEQKLGQADAAKADFAAARAAKPDIDAEFKTYGMTAE